mgnify:CR=1 FL=1
MRIGTKLGICPTNEMFGPQIYTYWISPVCFSLLFFFHFYLNSCFVLCHINIPTFRVFIFKILVCKIMPVKAFCKPSIFILVFSKNKDGMSIILFLRYSRKICLFFQRAVWQNIFNFFYFMLIFKRWLSTIVYTLRPDMKCVDKYSTKIWVHASSSWWYILNFGDYVFGNKWNQNEHC